MISGKLPENIRWIFAIGDIHGCMKQLRRALQEIDFRSKNEPVAVIFLGDYVDRGPASKDVIEALMNGPTNPKHTWITLKGNHEEMMVDALAPGASDQDMRFWTDNGGETTAKSYNHSVPPEHLVWINGLPTLFETENHIFVHAGLMPGFPVHEQSPQVCMWIRDRFLVDPCDFWGKHVVHGHTPYGPTKRIDQPELLKWRTNLDTGTFKSGVLTVAKFERNVVSGPVEVIQVNAEGQI